MAERPSSLSKRIYRFPENAITNARMKTLAVDDIGAGPVYVECTLTVNDRRRAATHNPLELRSFASASIADATGTEQVIRKVGSIAKSLEALHKEIRGKKSPGPSPKAIEGAPEQ